MNHRTEPDCEGTVRGQHQQEICRQEKVERDLTMSLCGGEREGVKIEDGLGKGPGEERNWKEGQNTDL